MVNRKLIRPNLSTITRERDQGRRGETSHSQPGPRRKQIPPEQTHAEEFYYLKQMQAKTPVTVVLLDGENLDGWIEWYDKNCIKVHRSDKPNLLVFKHHIKYIVKRDEADS